MWKIVIAVLGIACLGLALLSTLTVARDEIQRGYRAVSYAVMALTFAVSYRYFED